MIAIASTIQCSFIPRMYCQSNTESPNEAPSESSTVPTITTAATTLRVMISMMTKIRVAAAFLAGLNAFSGDDQLDDESHSGRGISGDQRVDLGAAVHFLYVAAVPPR